METIAILLMLAGGALLAGLTIVVIAIARRESERGGLEGAEPRGDAIAASILFHVLSAGGVPADEAARRVRRETGSGALITRGIDVTSWADSYARGASVGQREDLLEAAVRLAAMDPRAIPLRQYAALLDLSFGLGFQTDALARLRALHGLDHVDHAKAARPRSADRGGGGAPLFVPETRSRDQLLGILGLEGPATKQEISAAYRRLASRHHPDRFHGSSPEAEAAAAARFIEITMAYEALAQQDSG